MKIVLAARLFMNLLSFFKWDKVIKNVKRTGSTGVISIHCAYSGRSGLSNKQSTRMYGIISKCLTKPLMHTF